MAALAALGGLRYVLVCPVSRQREGGTSPDDSSNIQATKGRLDSRIPEEAKVKETSSRFISVAAGVSGGVKFGAAARSWPETCGRPQTSLCNRIPSAARQDVVYLEVSLSASRLPEAPFPQLSGSRSVIKHVSSRITVRNDRALASSLTFSAWIWSKR